MEYYFYYINRGGNNTKSMQTGVLTYTNDRVTNKQSLACDSNYELYDAVAQDANLFGIEYPPFWSNEGYTQNGNASGFVNLFNQDVNYPGTYMTQFPSLQHASYKNITTFPITNDFTASGRVQANITPLLESIYHCYSQDNLDTAKSIFY